MARLFKDRTIVEALEKFDISDFDARLKILTGWYDAYKSGALQQKTESQSEQAFNNDIFIKVLDHVSFPKESYTIDPKARTETSGQKPDAALGYFSPDEKHVHAVCEIKDVNTSLDKPQQREGNLTPVQQAFKYKPQYTRCDFVLVTNFYEMRLYRDNQLDYEVFTLGDLVNPENNYYQFRKFYYLLCRQNFIAKTGQSNTERILSAIRIEEEEISKKFYTEYRQLRRELISNIQKNNPDKSANLAIEKAQKIIDRIVFVSFCEDLGLLPDNKLMEVVQWAEKNSPFESGIWDTLVKFFAAVDHGSEKLGIPDGYNGELFKEDKELDELKIDDAITKKFVDLGRFSFSDDLTVNILGHIFEQSISDLESLKAAVEQVEQKKKDSRRKKEGIYYTPEYIVSYIVNNTVGRYLEEQEATIKQKHGLKEDILDKTYKKRALMVYQEYQQALQKIKVLDPACGSGAFLVKVFDFLFTENQRVAYILRDLRGQAAFLDQESFIKEILNNNIYGVDLNPESVEITKLSLWLKTAQKGKKLTSLKENIKCGNSLIDDPKIAGSRAFNWNEKFKDIMERGGFDVVVGNPPWGANIDQESEWIGRRYPLSTQKTKDTYKIFIDKGIQLIKEKGFFGYVIPNSFLYQPRYKDIRDLLSSYGYVVVNLGEDIFENVELPSAILTLKKSGGSSPLVIDFSQDNRTDIADKVLLLDSQKIKEQQQRKEGLVKNTGLTFDDVFLIKDAGINYQAVNVGKGKKGESKLSSKLLYEGSKQEEGDVEYFKGEDINRYWIKDKTARWVKTNYRNFVLPNERVILNKDFFEKTPKIIWRQTADKIIAAIDTRGVWFGRSIIGCTVKETYINKVDVKYALCIFNSNYINYLYRQKVLEVGRVFPQVKISYIKPLPFVISDDQTRQELVVKAESMISLTNEFEEAKSSILQVLIQQYGITKAGRKLESFYELDFDGFIKALKVQSLGLSEKEDLLKYFESQKSKLLALKEKIDTARHSIDQLVYKIYGLSEEEIQIIDNTH